MAAQVVDATVTGGRSLDAALEQHEAEVPANDVALLRMLCFGTIRHYFQLDEWSRKLLDRPLKRKDSVVAALLAVGLYQLTETRIPDHAAVSGTVEAARQLRRPRHAGLLNALLRRFMRESLAELPPGSEAARYNHPDWLIDSLREDWPDDWQAILDANNERAPMWLRVNARRMGVDAYRDALEAAGLESEQGVTGALRLKTPVSVGDLPGFDAGDVSVQDAAAQLAAPWLLEGAEPGRLLDACAAPGGKTAHLLELAEPGSELVAVDIDPERLSAVDANLARLKLSATVLAGDASKPESWWDGAPFAGILLDAPCSASGVIRRHPDIKLNRRASDIGRLKELQGQILDALWPLLTPGGRLLYVTCSVQSAENDAVTSAFVDRTPDARENDMLPNNNIRDVMRRKACGYQVLPGTAGVDGFYFACLEKVSA